MKPNLFYFIFVLVGTLVFTITLVILVILDELAPYDVADFIDERTSITTSIYESIERRY